VSPNIIKELIEEDIFIFEDNSSLIPRVRFDGVETVLIIDEDKTSTIPNDNNESIED